MFTWKPIYSELATALPAWRNRQTELIDILLAGKDQGVPVSTLKDEDKSGKKVPLQVMEPFTFFGFFNRKVKTQHRIKLLSLIKEKLGLTSAVPEDFDGIPIMFPQRTWFFSYESHREPHAIDTLWDFAQAIVQQPPESIPAELFDKALDLKQVGLPNLTMGMFWMRPDQYLAVDKRNRALLKKRGIEPNITDWKSYLDFLNQVKIQMPGLSWPELSQKAYQGGGDSPLEKRHWLFQANPQYFDLLGSLKAGALQTWQVNQHRKEIHSGDRLILWQSGKDAGVYALATVTSEVGEVQESPEEVAFRCEPMDINKPFIGVTLRVDTALCDTPIGKEELLKHKHTKALPLGLQGTNFPVTVKQFNAVEDLMPSCGNQRYWLYAPGDQAECWDECQAKEIMVVGYDDLPDFTTFKDRKGIEQMMKKLWKPDQRPSNHSLAVWEFANVLSPGDIVIPKLGTNSYLGYGIVTGPYARDDSRPHYKHIRPVHWVKTGSWKADFQLVQKTLTNITKYPDYVKKLRRLIGITPGASVQAPSPPVSFSSLNTILYGPPGTGKTFNTIERAVRTIEPQFDGNHVAHKARFDELRSKGQIEFITLHQSYSYEDFVEGLRPVTEPEEESNEARYRYCPGVFKRIAVQALFDCLKPPAPEATTTAPFDALWKTLLDHIESDPEKTYPGLTEKTSYRISLTSRGNLDGFNTIGNKNFLCARSVLERVYAAKNKSNHITSSDVLDVTGSGCHSHFVAAVFNELKRIEKTLPAAKKEIASTTLSWDQKAKIVQNFLRASESTPYTLKPASLWPCYVLVIDEINRGNISKILGELITLIEPDKRVGAEHSLIVQLPYTHEYFAVPGNLHIIGTMNTADKSIALVDVALRRRFQFEELRPNFAFCASLTPEMREALQALNRRICLRKDRDHQIGHSYFMSISNESGFNRIFDKHVIPLLQEYFYNDWEGLRFVLGEKNKNGTFIKPLDGCEGAEARTKWQWAADASNNGALNCLRTLLSNYQTPSP